VSHDQTTGKFLSNEQPTPTFQSIVNMFNFLEIDWININSANMEKLLYSFPREWPQIWQEKYGKVGGIETKPNQNQLYFYKC